MDSLYFQLLSSVQHRLGALYDTILQGGMAAKDGIAHLKHIWGCVLEEHIVAGAKG